MASGNMMVFKNSVVIPKKYFHTKQFKNNLIVRYKTEPTKIKMILWVLLFISLDLLIKNNINIIVSFTTKLIHPTELNIIERINDETIKTIAPEENPNKSVVKNTGISEKSSFKKGTIANIDMRPKKPKISEITINIALYVIVRILFVFIIICYLTYTKY